MMKRLFACALVCAASIAAHARPATWELVNFRFDDGGSAKGSFVYDSDTDRFSNIDVVTTAGSNLSGRHFTSLAGEWGRISKIGVLAFSDSTGPDFTGAGWFRIDAKIGFNPTVGAVVNQWMAVGAESFCINYACNSAANEITNPGKSRETISGYLLAVSPVPEPSSLVLILGGLAVLVSKSKRMHRGASQDPSLSE